MTARQDGFSLVEVLAALAVIAIAGTALVGALTQTARAGAMSEDRALAALAAENILNTAILDAGASGLQAQDGDYALGHRVYDYAITVEETSDPALNRVTLTLADAETGRTLRELTTFRGASR